MGYPPYNSGPAWPTIDTNNKELKIDRDKVKKIIDDLKNNDLYKYTTQHGASGLPDDLTAKAGAIQPQEIGAAGTGGGDPKTSYPAGEKAWKSIKKVNDPQNGFPTLYANFVNSYSAVVEALYQHAGIVDNAENDSQVPGTTNQNSGNPSSFSGNQQQS